MVSKVFPDRVSHDGAEHQHIWIDDRQALDGGSDYAGNGASLSAFAAWLRDRAVEAQQYRASGLALVTAAIALWNTVYLDRALDDLRCGSEMIPKALLAHLAPIGWQHINLTGDYLWDVDVGLAPDGFRALRTTATSLRPAVAA
jgi:Tn3 transposase DDE domain